MSSRQRKEWERIARRPKAVRFEELRRLLELSGWALARVRGSHHTFTKSGAKVTIPLRRPHVLPAYVRDVLSLTRPTDTGAPDEGDEED